MEFTKDPLHLLTGILALGFGIYCLIIGIGMTVFDLIDMNWFLLIMCIIFSIIYIIYGIFILLAKKNNMISFIGIVFIIMLWLPPGLEWIVWPMIIMPFVILALSLIILSKHFRVERR